MTGVIVKTVRPNTKVHKVAENTIEAIEEAIRSGKHGAIFLQSRNSSSSHKAMTAASIVDRNLRSRGITPGCVLRSDTIRWNSDNDLIFVASFFIIDQLDSKCPLLPPAASAAILKNVDFPMSLPSELTGIGPNGEPVKKKRGRKPRVYHEQMALARQAAVNKAINEGQVEMAPCTADTYSYQNTGDNYYESDYNSQDNMDYGHFAQSENFSMNEYNPLLSPSEMQPLGPAETPSLHI